MIRDWNRRQFLAGTLGAAATMAIVPQVHGVTGRKPPYRALYSSDTTHILTCTSPWHRAGEPLKAEHFLASVDESAVAGADAHVLQPGLGWVPWWPSKVLPLDEHVAWFQKHFRRKDAGNPFLRFVMEGGDFVKLTLDRCRERGIAGFLSFRLNDAHHKDVADDPKGARIEAVPRFYAEHPEFRLGKQPDATGYSAHLQDWSIPEVRDFKFRLIEELCRNYDFDGLELDFLRHPYFFRQQKTTEPRRQQIMAGFVGSVRRALDETRPQGKRRWLAVRIPARVEAHGALGIEPAALAAGGVDIFTLSSYYHLEQQGSMAQFRAKITDAACYQELTPVTAFNGDKNARSHRRATKEQLLTSAHLAYVNGADGVALYNFQYYRQQAHEPDPPAVEPPFELIPVLRDAARCAASPQHYFLGANFGEPRQPKRPLPLDVRPGKPAEFRLQLAPPAGGWKAAGKFRVQALEDMKDTDWAVMWNGHPLSASENHGEPYPNPMTQLLGREEQVRAWSVSAALLKPGENVVRLTLLKGVAVRLVFLDFGVS